jgi:histidine triad (HIT) family protein
METDPETGVFPAGYTANLKAAPRLCDPSYMACAFCAISSGELAASVVAREERLCAFLDARPVFKGHVLVVPREHVADLAALPEPLAGPLFWLARRVALALEEGLGAQGAFVGVNNKISQSVPHLHIHVVPRTKGDGLRGFFWPRTKYESDEEREGYARRIAGALR